MKNRPATRWEKLKLLNDLKSGKVSLFELKEKKYSAWIQDHSNENYFYNEEHGIKCKATEIKKHSIKMGCTNEIIVTYKEGFTIL